MAFPWESRPQSAMNSRRSHLQHQYSVCETEEPTAIRAVIADNARHSGRIRQATSTVDTGRNRNIAVAYWKRRQRACHRPTSAASSRSANVPQTCDVFVDNDADGGDAPHTVSMSTAWGGRKDDSSPVLSPPLASVTVQLPDGRTTAVSRPHQALVFHYPAPVVMVAESDTASNEPTADEGEDAEVAGTLLRGSAVAAPTPSTGPGLPSNRSPSKSDKSRAFRALTPADVFADAALQRRAAHAISDVVGSDDWSLLRNFGSQKGRWQGGL